MVTIWQDVRAVVAACQGASRAWRASWFVGLVACSLATAAPAAAGDTDTLTGEELRALARGELVVRPTTEERRGLDLIGGTSWQVIAAKPDVVWRALLDVKYYDRMLPRVVEARLVEEAGNVRTVFLRQGVGFIRTSYHLKVRADLKKQEIWFALDDTQPHGIEAAWGFYAVRPYPGGRTLLTYGVMADLGEGLLRTVVTGTVHDWMMRVPWMVKRFVEGSGKWIYK